MPHLENPHIDWPFRFKPTGRTVDGKAELQLAHVAQDSEADIRNQIFSVVATPLGFRDEDPSFGIPSPLFTQGDIDTTVIASAVSEFVGVDVRVEDYPDAINEALHTIQITEDY